MSLAVAIVAFANPNVLEERQALPCLDALCALRTTPYTKWGLRFCNVYRLRRLHHSRYCDSTYYSNCRRRLLHRRDVHETHRDNYGPDNGSSNSHPTCHSHCTHSAAP